MIKVNDIQQNNVYFHNSYDDKLQRTVSYDANKTDDIQLRFNPVKAFLQGVKIVCFMYAILQGLAHCKDTF